MKYERLTDRARRVFQLANQRAQRVNHEYVSHEDILYGLLKEGNGIAGGVLKSCGITLESLDAAILALAPCGPDMVTMGKLPMTPRASKIAEYAYEEATALKDLHVGTEHLLLGIIRDPDSVSVKALSNMGITADFIRERTLALLGVTGEQQVIVNRSDLTVLLNRVIALSKDVESLLGS